MNHPKHFSQLYDEGQDPDGNSTIELGELKGILIHRRNLILGTAVILTLIALIYSLLAAPRYGATSQIIIDPRDRQVVTNDVNPSSIAPDGGITQVESQVAVVQSNGVLLRAIKMTNLTADSEFNSRGILSRILDTILGSEPKTDTDSAVDEDTTRTLYNLRRKLSVTRDDKVLVINVTVTAKTANKAALLANAIAEAYLEDQRQARERSAQRAAQDLTARLAEQRKKVELAEEAVERYKSEHNLVMASGRLVNDQALTDVNTQLAAAQNLTSTLKAKVEQIRRQQQGGAVSGATSEALGSTVISSLRQQEATLAQRISDMQIKYGPRHPALVSALAQKSGVERMIRAELSRLAASATSDYDRAVASEKALAKQQKALEQKTLATDQVSVRLRELQRDLDAVRGVYANFLRRSQETREQSGIDSTNARIIGQAIPPLKKKWPPTLLLLAGAFWGGLGLGAGLALMAEYASPTALSEGQVQKTTGAPVLGVLPSSPKRLGLSYRSGTGSFSRNDNDLLVDLPSDVSGALGLALRRLTNTRSWQEARDATPAILLCSSSEDGEARARVATSLAATAAKRGNRVLFVDADMTQTDSEPVIGIQDVLGGYCRLWDAIGGRLASNIDFVSAGATRPILKESEAVRFAEMMAREAHGTYDLIILDGGDLTENIKASAFVSTANVRVLVAELRSTLLDKIRAQSDAVAIMGNSLTGTLLVDAKK